MSNSINFTYTAADLEQAFSLHYLKKHPIRSKLFILSGVVVILLALILIATNNQEFAKAKWVLLILGIFNIGLYFFMKKKMVNLALKNPSIKDINSLSFDNVKVRFQGAKGYFEKNWNEFTDLIEDEHSVLLYLTTNNFFIIPKRILAENDKALLLSIVKQTNK